MTRRPGNPFGPCSAARKPLRRTGYPFRSRSWSRTLHSVFAGNMHSLGRPLGRRRRRSMRRISGRAHMSGWSPRRRIGCWFGGRASRQCVWHASWPATCERAAVRGNQVRVHVHVGLMLSLLLGACDRRRRVDPPRTITNTVDADGAANPVRAGGPDPASTRVESTARPAPSAATSGDTFVVPRAGAPGSAKHVMPSAAPAPLLPPTTLPAQRLPDPMLPDPRPPPAPKLPFPRIFPPWKPPPTPPFPSLPPPR